MLFVSFAAVFPARADMGGIYPAEAVVSETSQKAIILHNLEEEVLILETDLQADRKTGLIRFIPFPSEPEVALAPEDAFQVASNLIREHGLVFMYQTKGGGEAEGQAVELLQHKKLGAHDLTVIKINDLSHFRSWVNDFFRSKGLPTRKSYAEVETVAGDYLKRGIAYFVFDFVELTGETRSIEPVAYKFKSTDLYYPLITSNTFGGEGDINLILFAHHTPCDSLYSYYEGALDLSAWRCSTWSQVLVDELRPIYPEAGTFFKDLNVYVQMYSYWGAYKFDQDLIFDISVNIPPGVKKE
ncbi:MAG: DUF2330 domain-containing protein [Thermodesulfobacteriota bacterium]